jgi:hypothetical protein
LESQRDRSGDDKQILPIWVYPYGKSINIFGASGFIGSWLVSSLLFAQQSLGIKIHLNLVSRNPQLVSLKFKTMNWIPSIGLSMI